LAARAVANPQPVAAKRFQLGAARDRRYLVGGGAREPGRHQAADGPGSVDADFHGAILFQEVSMFAFAKKLKSLLPPERTLPGRSAKMEVPAKHFVNGHPLEAPFPAGMQLAQFGMGCFWGAERLFWQTPGVYSTAVGYSGGDTKNPTYEE